MTWKSYLSRTNNIVFIIKVFDFKLVAVFDSKCEPNDPQGCVKVHNYSSESKVTHDYSFTDVMKDYVKLCINKFQSLAKTLMIS